MVLSGYTATLNPSDRATLHFLQLCEENGVDLTEFKPIVFGKEAVKQYTAKVRGRFFGSGSVLDLYSLSCRIRIRIRILITDSESGIHIRLYFFKGMREP